MVEEVKEVVAQEGVVAQVVAVPALQVLQAHRAQALPVQVPLLLVAAVVPRESISTSMIYTHS